MAKHSSGPWEFGNFYYPKDGGAGTCEITQVGELGIIAKIVLPAKGRSAHGEGEANAALIAAAPSMFDLIAEFGDAVTDMFEQMSRGNWTDDHGHDVRMNAKMLALKPLIVKAIELRIAIAKAEATP